MRWRWDQGHLEYFQFDAIRAIASVLVSLDGIRLEQSGLDPLRMPLEAGTGLPFRAPRTHKVWRQYARTFALELLVTTHIETLRCTELCYKLTDRDQQVSVDEYLTFVARRFYLPSPVFEDYANATTRVFPFCATLKFLMAGATAGKPQITLGELFSKVVGNDCTGVESLDHYMALPDTARRPEEAEGRQVREMLRFFSQFSFLKWQNPYLRLDTFRLSKTVLQSLGAVATPELVAQAADRTEELLKLGRLGASSVLAPVVESRIDAPDQEFIEGKRARVVHLRTERSRILRELFFTVVKPCNCDMCELNVVARYPWTKQLLEIHHKLPLSSPVHVEKGRTSLKDLVGLCPTCHRATHGFYRTWLDGQNLLDFRSAAEASAVYDEAKKSVVL